MEKGQGVDGWQVLEMRTPGYQRLGAKEISGGKEGWSLTSPFLAPARNAILWEEEGGWLSKSCLWSSSSEEKPLTPKYADSESAPPRGGTRGSQP